MSRLLPPSPAQRKYKAEDIQPCLTFPQLINIMKCCCLCKGVPTPVFLSCQNGHITCLECAQPGSRCIFRYEENSECRFPLVMSNSHTLSEIMRNVRVACPRRCGMTMTVNETETHHLVCDEIPRLTCLLTGCNDKILYTKKILLSHLLQHHECKIHQSSQGFFAGKITEAAPSRDLGNWKVPFIIKYDGVFFICAYGREMVDESPSLVVIMFAATDDNRIVLSRDSRGSIMFTNEQRDSYRKYTGLFPDICRSTKADAIQSFNCLVLPVEMALTVNFYLEVRIQDSGRDQDAKAPQQSPM